MKEQAREFSELKIGYRGDLRSSKAEVFDMTQVFGARLEPEKVDFVPSIQLLIGQNMEIIRL